MEVTNSLLPAMASCRSAVFHYFLDSEVLLDLTSLLIISQILGMPLPMKDYVCFSETHLWSFFLILPGSKILQCFPWIFSWVLIHKLNHFHRVYVLKSQPHELVFHWGVDSCFSESYTQENASLLWASQESQSYVSCNFKMICAVAAFISEEGYCRVFRILCPSCHSEICTPVQKFSLDSCLSEALSSRLPQESLPRHSYMDTEGTLSLIFLSSLPLRSWTLSYSFLVNFLSHIRAYQPHPHGIITAS